MWRLTASRLDEGEEITKTYEEEFLNALVVKLHVLMHSHGNGWWVLTPDTSAMPLEAWAQVVRGTWLTAMFSVQMRGDRLVVHRTFLEIDRFAEGP